MPSPLPNPSSWEFGVIFDNTGRLEAKLNMRYVFIRVENIPRTFAQTGL